MAAEIELLLDESAGSGSGGSSDDTDSRLEEKREEDGRELWAFMLQVCKSISTLNQKFDLITLNDKLG